MKLNATPIFFAKLELILHKKMHNEKGGDKVQNFDL